MHPETKNKKITYTYQQTCMHAYCRAATFFVSAFWKDYKAQADFTSDQLRRLGNEQYDDMRIRY
jgi:hypothetical protein